MSWRTNLITGMTHSELLTLTAMIAGSRPDVFDWAAEGMRGSFGERFAHARVREGETPRCRTCGALIDSYADPHDGITPRWRHLVLPGASSRDTARFLDTSPRPYPRAVRHEAAACRPRRPAGDRLAAPRGRARRRAGRVRGNRPPDLAHRARVAVPGRLPLAAVMRGRITAAVARLAERMNARSRGRCPCPLCSLAERQAREQLGMPLRHPERITRELPRAEEELLAVTAAELWPTDEWTEITAEKWKEDQP